LLKPEKNPEKEKFIHSKIWTGKKEKE